jgi:ribosomal protein S6--L-glutamate ligase
MSKESPFFRNAPMILSFHPCFVADAQIILADRQLSAEDRRLIQAADAIILPQTCSPALYKVCSESVARVFPDYAVRFKYPGKVGQSLLFEKLKIPCPATRRWRSVERFRDSLWGGSAPLHDMPFFLKADKSHEGDGVLFVTDRKSLDTALARLGKVGSAGFISQELIPCRGNVLRTVVLHREIITYWKRADPSRGVIATVSHGTRIDEKWRPELQQNGRAQAQWICEETGINLAALDFVFPRNSPETQPLILEINYYFGRRGLGGSLRYYRLLRKAIQEWLKENGFDAERIRLV